MTRPRPLGWLLVGGVNGSVVMDVDADPPGQGLDPDVDAVVLA
jgi:hypothetical protein